MTAIAGAGEEPLAATLARAAAGDEAAFTRIVQAHHTDMARVCYLICGDLHQAEDAAAAAWVVAWRKLVTLRDPERLRPWLLSVPANEARQSVRRRRRRALVEVHVDDVTLGGLPGGPQAARDLDGTQHRVLGSASINHPSRTEWDALVRDVGRWKADHPRCRKCGQSWTFEEAVVRLRDFGADDGFDVLMARMVLLLAEGKVPAGALAACWA